MNLSLLESTLDYLKQTPDELVFFNETNLNLLNELAAIYPTPPELLETNPMEQEIVDSVDAKLVEIFSKIIPPEMEKVRSNVENKLKHLLSLLLYTGQDLTGVVFFLASPVRKAVTQVESSIFRFAYNFRQYIQRIDLVRNQYSLDEHFTLVEFVDFLLNFKEFKQYPIKQDDVVIPPYYTELDVIAILDLVYEFEKTNNCRFFLELPNYPKEKFVGRAYLYYKILYNYLLGLPNTEELVQLHNSFGTTITTAQSLTKNISKVGQGRNGTVKNF